MIKLSGVILAHNESTILKRCIAQLAFCTEVLIIDDSSTDQINKIAREAGAKVYKRALNNNFAQQRNFALTKAVGEWVLFVDPDEVVSKELAEEIQTKIHQNTADGFYIKRKDIWLGKHFKYGETGEVCLIRLGKRKKGQWLRAVHEHWFVQGKTDTLRNVLLHYPHPSVKEFIAKINYYSLLHAQENEKEGKAPLFLYVLLFPLAKFFVYYILKRGFMDGVHGFVVAVIMAFHSYLAWSNLWMQKNYSKYNVS